VSATPPPPDPRINKPPATEYRGIPFGRWDFVLVFVVPAALVGIGFLVGWLL